MTLLQSVQFAFSKSDAHDARSKLTVVQSETRLASDVQTGQGITQLLGTNVWQGNNSLFPMIMQHFSSLWPPTDPKTLRGEHGCRTRLTYRSEPIKQIRNLVENLCLLAASHGKQYQTTSENHFLKISAHHMKVTLKRIFAATLVRALVLSISQPHLVVVLAALLHRWTIGAIVFLCKTSKQKKILLCNRISTLASWSYSSGHLALTNIMQFAKQVEFIKSLSWTELYQIWEIS